MTQANLFNKNKNLVFNNNIESENKKNESRINSNLKNQPNTYSYPIFSDYCNVIKNEIISEEIINSKNNIMNSNYDPKGGGNSINRDINCSSTFEIIEYPAPEKPKNLKNQALIETNKHQYDKNLKYYKMPLDIKGDSDDEIYLDDEDFKNKNEKSKYSFQKTHSQNNYSKTSSFTNNELFSDYNNQKKIIVILNNTKKYHQELKDKINNFKKLIYSSKETKLDIVKEYSNKKIKKEISSINNNKGNKNEKDILINYTNTYRNHYLKTYKKDNLSNYKKNNFDNNKIKDIPLSDIKIKGKSFNTSNFSNNSTIKSKDKISNIFPKKSFKSAIGKRVENNIKKENNDTNKKLQDICNLNISSVINNDYSKEKSRINSSKNSNYLTFKSNRTSSTEKSKNIKEKNNKSKKYKNENKMTNQKNIYDLSHILPYSNQKIKIKNEKNKIEKIKVNNKIENNNPFRDDSNKKDFKHMINKDCIRGKELIKISEKILKKNAVMKSPKKKCIYFSLQTIKE